MFSSTRSIRAKLSRLSFRKRLAYAVPTLAVAYTIKKRREFSECDELLYTPDPTAIASAGAGTADGAALPPAEAPAAARARKWAQLVALARAQEDTAGNEGVAARASPSSSSAPAPLGEEPPILDLVVIGAGANGLFTTLEAGRRGLSVVALDACDIGGSTSSSTPNLLSAFLPHIARAVKVFSGEEFAEGYRNLMELNKMMAYTNYHSGSSGEAGAASAAASSGGGARLTSSSIVTTDVRMALPSASRMETIEVAFGHALWSAMAAFIGTPCPTSGSGGMGRLFRTVPPAALTLTSDWVGDDGKAGAFDNYADDGADSSSSLFPPPVEPFSVFYMRHARIDGARMAVALATTAERLRRGPAKQSSGGDAPSCLSSPSALPDAPIILNYCPVQSVGVDPKTGLFKVTVMNGKPDGKKKGSASSPSYVTLTTRNVVNCAGPWTDSLRIADIAGDVAGEAAALAGSSSSTSLLGAADVMKGVDPSLVEDPEVLAMMGAHHQGNAADGANTTSSTTSKAGSERQSASRRLVRQTAAEKATGYEVRELLAHRDLAGEKMLVQNSNGHIYFVVNHDETDGKATVDGSTVTNGFIRSDGEQQQQQQQHASAAQRLNSAMTLTTDAARRYITMSPYGAEGSNTSIVGLSTVALPLLGWRGEPSATGLPFSDPSHYARVYEWIRKCYAEAGIALPPKASSCVVAASGTVAPLSEISREIYICGGAVESVAVAGSRMGSMLYHVFGGNWLTARRHAVDVVQDIQLNAIRRREGYAVTNAPNNAAIPTMALRKEDAAARALLAKEEQPFTKPLRLVTAPAATAAPAVGGDSSEGSATTPPPPSTSVAAQLTAAMQGDAFVTSIIDVIARRTTIAYTHHAQVKRMLPALVEAMGAQQGEGFEWSNAKKAEELKAAQWFMDGIAPPPSL